METPPLLSTAYLPSIRYMAIMASHSLVVIEQHETFPKQTFRNRAEIATGNGGLMLNVPVSRPNGNHTRTGEITISYNEPWNIRHWRAIESAYSAAPYFLYYKDELEQAIMAKHNRLLELNNAILCFLMKKMKIVCQVEYSERFTPYNESSLDYRINLTSKKNQCGDGFPPYSQVFDSRYGFKPNLSAIDLLFNLGPEARSYLLKLPKE